MWCGGANPASPNRTRRVANLSCWEAARAGKVKLKPQVFLHWECPGDTGFAGGKGSRTRHRAGGQRLGSSLHHGKEDPAAVQGPQRGLCATNLQEQRGLRHPCATGKGKVPMGMWQKGRAGQGGPLREGSRDAPSGRGRKHSPRH